MCTLKKTGQPTSASLTCACVHMCVHTSEYPCLCVYRGLFISDRYAHTENGAVDSSNHPSVEESRRSICKQVSTFAHVRMLECGKSVLTQGTLKHALARCWLDVDTTPSLSTTVYHTGSFWGAVETRHSLKFIDQHIDQQIDRSVYSDLLG